MKTIIRYTILTASRDLLFIGLFLLVLALYGLAIFTGSTALTEQSQMSLAYFAGSSRMVLIIGLIVFVCFHVRRMFENREVESILSKPITRTEFVISYWMGFVALVFIVTMPATIIIALLFKSNITGLMFWSISMLFEASMVVAFAMLSALILRSAVGSVLASFSFYIIARLMGFFTAALDQPGSLMTGGSFGFIPAYILKAISTIVPRLDLYAKSEWLIYGVDGQVDLWIFQVQTLIYIPLLLAVAVFDFKRKEF